MLNKYLAGAVVIASTSLAFIAFSQGVNTPNLSSQSPQDAAMKSTGCVSSGCHVNTEPMHTSPSVRLGCTDCHGGNANTTDKKKAHVLPSDADLFKTTATPENTAARWLKESVQ